MRRRALGALQQRAPVGGGLLPGRKAEGNRVGFGQHRGRISRLGIDEIARMDIVVHARRGVGVLVVLVLPGGANPGARTSPNPRSSGLKFAFS